MMKNGGNEMKKTTGTAGQTQYIKYGTTMLGGELYDVMYVIEAFNGSWTLGRIEKDEYGNYDTDEDCLGFFNTKKDAVAEMMVDMA